MKDLKKLLLESCNEMRLLSDRCSLSSVTDDGRSHNAVYCNWYHGAWQYLRILNCVSSPQWHEEFYKKSFKSAIGKKQTLKVLISGTADYSLLYLLVSVLTDAGVKAKIHIVDICSTPLRICEWFAKNYIGEVNSDYRFIKGDDEGNRTFKLNDSIEIETFKKNIIFYPASENKYDIVCSDAFLTRFTDSGAKSVLVKWSELLNKDGRIVTTARIYEDSQTAGVSSLAKISLDINTFCNKVIERYEKLDAEEKNKMELSKEELRFIAFRYIERMRSNRLGNKDQLITLFSNSDLKIIDKESYPAEVPGEINKTTYFQIVAKKV